MKCQKQSKLGFTLIEVLLVVVIIAILAAIVLIAINPARQIAQSNNAQRRADVQSLINAVGQYAIDHRGALPSALTGSGASGEISNAGIDVCADVVPTYIAAMNFDPTAAGSHYTDCTDYATGYNITTAAGGRLTVNASNAELGETISVTR